MAKITLSNILSGYRSNSVVNANNDTIEDHLNNKVLYRDNPSGEPNTMLSPLDMNNNPITNVGTDPENPDSAITSGEADARYVKKTGSTMTGALNVRVPLTNSEPARKDALDVETAARIAKDDSIISNYQADDNAITAAYQAADSNITNNYQSADTSLQSQISGGEPLTGSAFSEISWHDQSISNSIAVPSSKNAWSFGPVMSIATGQAVTIGAGSTWTIADGEAMGGPEGIGVPSYDTVTVTLNGGFNTGSIILTKIGNSVTAMLNNTVTHNSLASVQSLDGLVPTIYRPVGKNATNCYHMGTFFGHVTITADGAVALSYKNFDGTDSAQTTPVTKPSLFYIVE